MAQVHPSRMALVPQSSSYDDRYNQRPSPSSRDRNERDSRKEEEGRGSRRHRSRSRSPPTRRSRSPRRSEANRDRQYDSPSRRDGGRSSPRAVYPPRRPERSNSPSPRKEKHGGRERERSRSGERRRESPSYEAYRERQASGDQAYHLGEEERPHNNWSRNRQQDENGYNVSNPQGNASWQRNPRGGGDFFEERRKRRDAMTINIWPPSPREPVRSLSPDTKGRKDRNKHRSKRRDRSRDGKTRDDDRKRRKRRRSPSTASSSSMTDSSEEERRRSRKKSKREDSYERRSRSRDRRERPSGPRQSRSPSRSVELARVENVEDDEDEWVEKDAGATTMAPPPVPVNTFASPGDSQSEEDMDDEEVGPMPLQKTKERVDEREYGGALLRGEGSAMAAFVQDNARIPRRGEIGLTSDQIASFEDVGYVMSGSRHRRMNAVRIRKENQVISAEEKRSILRLQKEENRRREELLKAEFKELVEEQLGNIGAAKK
ncbi:hypothetical protein FRC17_003794 [Serendipita sp. 399]|nr:hypothetical protein FRC17_003794 [Serendipita sp. 399]